MSENLSVLCLFLTNILILFFFFFPFTANLPFRISLFNTRLYAVWEYQTIMTTEEARDGKLFLITT